MVSPQDLIPSKAGGPSGRSERSLGCVCGSPAEDVGVAWRAQRPMGPQIVMYFSMNHPYGSKYLLRKCLGYNLEG